jgi:hypothetical protein
MYKILLVLQSQIVLREFTVLERYLGGQGITVKRIVKTMTRHYSNRYYEIRASDNQNKSNLSRQILYSTLLLVLPRTLANLYRNCVDGNYNKYFIQYMTLKYNITSNNSQTKSVYKYMNLIRKIPPSVSRLSRKCGRLNLSQP